MALYLALDTATDAPSVALGTPAVPGEDLRVGSRRELSREIDRVVASLLEKGGIAAAGLAGVLVADGPGSFTGLRIGIAFAKGLCRAADVPLFSAPSLMGAARVVARGAEAVVAEYDALRGEVFRAVYRFGASVEVLADPAVVASGSPLAFPGASRATARDASASSLPRLVGVPGGVAAIAALADWEPAYGRPAEAEARRRARLASAHGA